MKKTAFFLFIANLFFAQISYGKTLFKKDDLSLNLSGNANIFLAKTNQQSSFENSYLADEITQNYLNKNIYLAGDSQIFLEAKKQEENFNYGAIFKGETNINNSRFNQKPTLDQAHLFLENDNFGKLEFGNYFAVNQKMKAGPARFARGAGGINGKYLELVNLPMLTSSSNVNSPICQGNSLSANCANVKLPNFILLAQSPIAHGGFGKGFNSNLQGNNKNYFNRSNFRNIKDSGFEGFEDSTKINYYMPRIGGLQFGASYSYDNNNQGITQNTARDLNEIYLKNIISVGVNYLHYFNNLTLTISATAEKGEAENSKHKQALNDLLSYDFGFSLSYFGFELGASYGWWGKSLQPKTGIYSCNYNVNQNLQNQNCQNSVNNFSNPYYYTIGLAYKIGGFGTSLTSINSNFQNNKYEAISLGFDYKLKRHLISYFEITKFAFQSNQALALDIANQNAVNNAQRQIRDNQGYVFLSGILFNF